MARAPRKAGSKGAGPRKKVAASKGSRKKPGGRRSGGGARQGWFARTWRRVLKLGAAALVGLLGALALVVWVLYRQALGEVDALLQGPVWDSPGAVLSAPLEAWPGLAETAEELAQDLQAAGYARVRQASSPGDFQVGPQDVLVLVPAARGPGWKVEAADVHVAFSDGRVSAVSPGGRATFAPVELAGVRGPDNEARQPVTLDEVPRHLADAVVAMEDSRFFEHEGLDPLGIARALLVNAIKGGTAQGGSTLTQQVVKNLFLTQERTYERKAREAVLAVALEQRRSKEEILTLYLNEIYLGQVGGVAVCGVQQAAHAYFGKTAQRLTLEESATLVGIVPAPNRYSPLHHPELALERRDLVLKRMVQVGRLAFAEGEKARQRPLEVHPLSGGRRAPWLVDAAIDRVERELGEGSVAGRGVRVHTTLQPALQRLAERAVAEGAAELDASHPEAAGAQVALVAVQVRDGAVVALVGGRDYGESQFDRGLSADRQVGSTIKPFTALFAFEDDPDLAPSTLLVDEPIERQVDGQTWSPSNYDGRYLGEITLRQALAQSRNIPAVLLAERVGLSRLRAQWQSLGLEGATALPSSALGAFAATPVELAGAYTVFPGGGVWTRPRLVAGATDAQDQVLWTDDPVRARRASARAAFLATSLLEEVMVSGTGRGAARYGVRGAVGGKTGTTDSYHDAWFAGFTGDLAVAVWVGFDRGRDLGLSGGQAALPVWARFVAWSGTAGRSFTPPPGVVQVPVCDESHLPATERCPVTAPEWFGEGHVPARSCPIHATVLDKAGQAADNAWDKVRRVLSRRKRDRSETDEEETP